MSELSELFDLDPLKLTKDDPLLLKAIEAYRAMAYKFNLDGTTTKSSAKPTGKAKQLADALGSQLGDLTIKL